MTAQFFISAEEHSPLSTEAEEIDALLDLLADPSKFTGDLDLDLVMDSALVGLLHFSELPPRTIEVMLGIDAIDAQSDLMFTRKMMAAEVLAGSHDWQFAG